MVNSYAGLPFLFLIFFHFFIHVLSHYIRKILRAGSYQNTEHAALKKQKPKVFKKVIDLSSSMFLGTDLKV